MGLEDLQPSAQCLSSPAALSFPRGLSHPQLPSAPDDPLCL